MEDYRYAMIKKMKNFARILLGLFLLFAGVGHLSFLRQEFLAQVPSWIPVSSDFVVLASGVVEVILGCGLVCMTEKSRIVGIATAVFFVLIFPGNVSQYVNGIDAFGLNSDTSRLVRLFFQPILIYWALWSTKALKD